MQQVSGTSLFDSSISKQEDLDIENAASFSDAIGFMVNGKNIVSFTPKKVYYHKMWNVNIWFRLKIFHNNQSDKINAIIFMKYISLSPVSVTGDWCYRSDDSYTIQSLTRLYKIHINT